MNFKSQDLITGEQTEQMKIALDKCFLDKPLIVLTFASPLVRKHQDDKLFEMELLDYSKEF